MFIRRLLREVKFIIPCRIYGDSALFKIIEFGSLESHGGLGDAYTCFHEVDNTTKSSSCHVANLLS